MRRVGDKEVPQEFWEKELCFYQTVESWINKHMTTIGFTGLFSLLSYFINSLDLIAFFVCLCIAFVGAGMEHRSQGE